MPRPSNLPLALTFLAFSAGCDLPPAHGDANAFIVGASPEVWSKVQAVFLEVMDPTIPTVRTVRPFRITHQDPNAEEAWNLLRRFRQVVVIGTEGDPWLDEALAAHAEAPPAGDADGGGRVASTAEVVQVDNVWSRGQRVSALALPGPDPDSEAVRALAEALHATLDAQFREYAVARMFVSGRNTALQDSLAARFGFSLLFPQVYRSVVREDVAEGDSVYRFRNDNPGPAELIREIAVTWRSPAPQDPTAEELRAWRDEISVAHYNDPQAIDTTVARFSDVEVNGLPGVEYQAAWVNTPGGWPAGGPFITRALRCPVQDRLYYVDAWLYAPNEDNYEYVIQLETILDSFRCP